jgi:hypothetical protein
VTRPILEVVPVSIRDASAFVALHHRHHPAPRGAIFALACGEFPAIDPVRIVGVATVGRPVARNLADGWTAEITRVCVLPAIGNGCSLLYGACWRAARAMGYRRLVTYTLPSEGGGVIAG